MMVHLTRRQAAKGVAAAAGLLAWPHVARAQAARIIVVGGGFAGAACARQLKRADSNLVVTLIEPSRPFTACPFSNQVIAGLRGIEQQQFTHDRIAAEGVSVVPQAVTAIDPARRRVAAGDGTSFEYDRLVLAPGIDLRFDALEGYDENAAEIMPHAWKGSEQMLLLRRQLEAMEDGGVVALAVPANPSRCPPAPYERASLIAHYLKASKPRSKVLILDAKDSFSQQRLFEQAWQQLYPGLIERVPLSDGGRVTAVNPKTRSIVTEFGNYDCAVGNVIPPQKAGHIAGIAGAADKTGWCPIDPTTFASALVPGIHVIGDAVLGGAMPKSAAAAVAQGKACADILVAQLSARPPASPRLTGICYDVVAPGHAFSLSGVYQPKDSIFAEVEGGTSPLDAPDAVRAREAAEAQQWYDAITAECFG